MAIEYFYYRQSAHALSKDIAGRPDIAGSQVNKDNIDENETIATVYLHHTMKFSQKDLSSFFFFLADELQSLHTVLLPCLTCL